MSWQQSPMYEFVCVCVTHHGTALAAVTTHLATYEKKEAQLIRSQTDGKCLKKKWEEVSRKQ